MAERWGGGRPDGGAVFKVGTNKRDIELDDSRGGGMGMKCRKMRSKMRRDLQQIEDMWGAQERLDDSRTPR